MHIFACSPQSWVMMTTYYIHTQYIYSSWLHAASSHMCCTQWCLMHGLLQKIKSYYIYMCARFELTIFSNRYYIAHTSASFTIEGLWLIELIFSDKDLQHHYCSICSRYHVFTTACDSSISTIMPIGSGGVTDISKWLWRLHITWLTQNK